VSSISTTTVIPIPAVPGSRTAIPLGINAEGVRQDLSPELFPDEIAASRTFSPSTINTTSSYDYFLIPLTSQNEFYGDQTDKVNFYAPFADFEEYFFGIKNTATAITPTNIYLQYYDGAVWQNLTGGSIAIVAQSSSDNPPQTNGWVAIDAGAQAAGFAPIRAQRSAYDAATDLSSVFVYLRRTLKYPV